MESSQSNALLVEDRPCPGLAMRAGTVGGSELDEPLFAGERVEEPARCDADLVGLGGADQGRAPDLLKAALQGVCFGQAHVLERIVDAMCPEAAPQSPAGGGMAHPAPQDEVQERQHEGVSAGDLAQSNPAGAI